MSIHINWERATSGPDGEALAERIREFIHEKFQQIALPRFIRSVQATSFEFGTVAPELEIKDLCNPFPDFYEDDESSVSDASFDAPNDDTRTGSYPSSGSDPWNADNAPSDQLALSPRAYHYQGQLQLHHPPALRLGDTITPYLFPRSGTSGILGTSNLGYNYYRMSLAAPQTPLAGPPSLADCRGIGPTTMAASASITTDSPPHASEPEPDSVAQSRPSTSNNASQPSHSSCGPSGSGGARVHGSVSETVTESEDGEGEGRERPRRMHEPRAEDFQVLCQVRYAGNIKLSLTADILLDYPMPSFVGLPLKLNVTGLSFDGIAVVAYIRRRVHLCFLSPEDSAAWLSSPSDNDFDLAKERASGSSSPRRDTNSLLKEIRVDTEIGRKENGKQVLKNVGKVEKFVLEQVRRIFDEEFVYPSFWTFLV